MGQTQTAPAKGNQSEGEFFALVATGRQGVEDMAAKMGTELQTIAAPNVKQDFPVWMQRAIVEVTTSDALRDVIRTREGIYSIYQGLAKAATLGLQIGGTFPHAYLVPRGGKATLQPSQDGYIFAATYGPGAILATPPELVEVYDKDEFVTDGKTMTHKYAPFAADRGKLVGFVTQLELKDGRRAVRHITMAEVEGIEKGYGQLNSPAYTKSPMDMHRKTAMKKMLKPIVKLCEGLAMLMQLDDYQAQAAVAPREPDMRDVTERAADRLDRAAAGIEPSESRPDPEPEAKPTTEPATDDDELDIFGDGK